MPGHLRDFTARFQDGIEVAVSGSASDELLGVREGFVRYFVDGLKRSVPLVLVPHGAPPARGGLPLSDSATVEMLRQRVDDLEDAHGSIYDFFVATAGGFHSVAVGEHEERHFVRSWAVVRCVVGESWGGSGSVEIPALFMSDQEARAGRPAVPGTRRKGGMTSSLTLGLETRRSCVAAATLNALSSVLYGIVGSGGGSRR